MKTTKKKLKRGTPEYVEFMREAGRKGGNATKRKMLAKNPHYYEDIGFRGGVKLLEERGKDYFRDIRRGSGQEGRVDA